MISLMNLDEWGREVEIEEGKVSSKTKKKDQEQVCACGRKVCCGKHKNGQCSCQQRGREHE